MILTNSLALINNLEF